MQIDPSRHVTEHGPSIGLYRDNTIPAWFITGDGKRHEYVGICGKECDLSTMPTNQSVISPGLIYQDALAATKTVQKSRP